MYTGLVARPYPEHDHAMKKSGREEQDIAEMHVICEKETPRVLCGSHNLHVTLTGEPHLLSR
ncbi:MAG: hypothetical protein M1570_15210 [Chloroflexi bacterium]|nr:hypothetical protein [Chloroflexota bacterium]